MSDTQGTTAVPAKRLSESKTIVKTSVFGHPMSHLSETVSKVIVGRVIGYATKVSKNTVEDQATGEEKTIKSLLGSFKAIPVDEKRNITASSKLGFPVHILQPMIDAVEANQEDGVIMEIAFDVGCETSKNAAGYSWFAIPLMEASADDPLAALEARLAGKDKPKELAAPPAKEPEAAHGKKK